MEVSRKKLNIDDARTNFLQNYKDLKGFIQVCSSYNWKPGKPGDPCLKVYIQSVEVMESFPFTCLGFPCEYYVMPNGMSVGCD